MPSMPGDLPPRQLVATRYKDVLRQRASNPDRIAYDGDDLKDLDPELVTLSITDQENPRSWKRGRKWVITMLLGAYTFFAPFTSTMFAPALKSVKADLHETNSVLGALQIGIFLIAFAVTPIFLAPLSEIYGRMVVVRIGNVIFIAFCIGGGFSRTTAQLAVCRFFSGVGGSASLAVYGGVLADLWDLKDRARASAALGGTLLLGPVLGPVCGGWLSERISWRWSCWVPAIGAFFLEVIVQFFYEETFIPVLLKRKRVRLVRDSPEHEWYTVLDLDDGAKAASAVRIIDSISRPLIYMFLDPVLGLLSLYYAFVFGVLYLVIATFQIVFGGLYGQSPGIVGLDLISEGIGALAGMFASVKLLELIYERQMVKNTDMYKPETSAFPGAFCVTVGLFVYGFTAVRTHFMVPLVGIGIFSFGMTNTYMSIQLYLIDSFDFPASAIAAVSVLRCIFAGVFPLFGEKLFEAIGIDWGVGMLAFLTLALGGPFFPLIYRFGAKLRASALDGDESRRRVGISRCLEQPKNKCQLVAALFERWI